MVLLSFDKVAMIIFAWNVFSSNLSMKIFSIFASRFSMMVVKKDGRREPFDRKKILAGIIRACEKRPVSMEKMEEIVSQVERQIQKKSDREVPSTRIGELVIEKLKSLDDVAYVRFASVYRQFKDVSQFMEELKGILGKEQKTFKRKNK